MHSSLILNFICEQGISQHRINYFDGRQISIIVHHSASDRLAVESFTGLACLGLSLIPFKERERVSGKVSNQRFVNAYVSGKLT